jgi:Kef-type K+ transport system membrane component KefB
MRRPLSLLAGMLVLLVAVALMRTWIAVDADTIARPGPFDELPAMPPAGLATSSLALGLLLLGALLAGEMATLARLPRVSGALVWGILVGPELHAATGLPWPPLLPGEELAYLELIDALAVSLIGLVAGSEIRVDFLRESGTTVAKLVTCQAGCVLLAATGGLVALSGSLPLLGEVTAVDAWFMALLIGVVSVANSPAIVVAMIREAGASGFFARTAMSMTVAKDLLLVVAFTVLLAWWTAAGHGGGGAALKVAWHLSGSLLAGLVVAGVLFMLAWGTRARLDLLLVVIGFAIALAGRLLEIAPLLAGITAGFALVNFAPQRSRPLFGAIENLLPATYALFFAVAGARIGVMALLTLWPLAAVVAGLRLLGNVAGLQIGCRWSGITGPTRAWLWTSMIPQAGVTIALATEARTALQDEPWTVTLHALLLSVVAIHELLGPPLLRLGLLRSGEVRR